MANSSTKSKPKRSGKAADDFADLESRPALVALRKRIAAVVALAPLSIDDEPIRALLGEPEALHTLREVAFAFDRERNTVQTSWRGGGMPGVNGAYDPVAILCWLLRRETKRSNQASSNNGYRDDYDRRELAQIELEAARADLSIKQSRADRVAGEFVAVALARSDFSAALGIIRDEVMGIGRALMPFCPRGTEIQFREEADRQCERILNAAADRVVQAVERDKEPTKRREDER